MYDVKNPKIEVPEEWKKLDSFDLSRVIMIVGGTDVGKSTLAKHLYNKLIVQGRNVAYLDGDPGQGGFGPPTMMNLVVNTPINNISMRVEANKRWFVGSISPRGHMLPIVVGSWRLVQAAYRSGVDCVIYDTTGLIDPRQGGVALKLAKIDLIQPKVVVSIQCERELEPLLNPLRRFNHLQLVELRPVESVIRRSRDIRQQNRADRYANYFSRAKEISIYWPRMAVIPRPRFTSNRLLSLEGQDGFTSGLGIVVRDDRVNKQVTVLTPLESLEGVEILRIGNVAVDPSTYRDEFV